MLTPKTMIIAVLAVQLLCAIFFVSDIVISVLGLSAKPISWHIREMIEIAAAFGLILGVLMGAVALRRTVQRNLRVEGQLKAASGAFAELMEEKFVLWQLTPAERDVALFVIKGMNTAEIAGLRDTSEGTVKAQTNAIYRKAGVSSRSQLVSSFIEDLMGETLI
ncbi:MAG: LuxR C-terminal-related transcriptional regulator [Pseudomonadota bacterium]